MNKKMSIIYLFSWLIAAFGQAAWVPFLGPFAASMGFALFWYACRDLAQRKQLIIHSTVWYATIHLVHLSWMTAINYAGPLILIAYFGLALLAGIQFACLTWWFLREERLSVTRLLCGCAFWVWMEWSRLWIFCGHPWGAWGIYYAWSSYAFQMATLFGVYGLSFWVALSNGMFYRWLLSKTKSHCFFSLSIIFLPYLFSWGHITYHQSIIKSSSPPILRVALVQPAQYPDELLEFDGPRGFIHFIYEQWLEIFTLIKDLKKQNIDLLVFPEGSIPGGDYTSLFHLDLIQEAFQEHFNPISMNFLAPLKEPIAREMKIESKKNWVVSNAYIAQSLANYLDLDLIIVMEGIERKNGERVATYNSAFTFGANEGVLGRYDKRILLPVAEYIPFEWARSLSAHFGIYNSFTPGTHSLVVNGKKANIALAICYEEMYGHMMRDNLSLGADVLVGISNDVWYPNSKLAKQHFYQSIYRSVECGIPVLRSSNVGLTAAIDSLGSIKEKVDEDNLWNSSVLIADIPLYKYNTIYSICGDYFILVLSFVIVFICFLFENRRFCN
ncbi:MAG: apolipoprotein N-acyltransferase [Waddliaceae bacterium]|nr:apolipoprotein N-acyltransferase [Waddliaceae bacterium]